MYKPLQKKNSSWTATSIQKKSKNVAKPGSSTVQAKRDTLSDSQELPSYSTTKADLLAENIMRSLETKEQEQVDTPTVQRFSEPGGAGLRLVAPPIVSTPVVQSSEIGIMRECAECAKEGQENSGEEGKEFDHESLTASGIQTKLTVGAPGDVYEQEADRVAAQVMSMPDNSPQVQRFAQEENPVQMKSLAHSITPLVQRRVDESVQMRELVQRVFQAGGTEASGDLESSLNASKGGGSPLAPSVRAFMEPRFGADFSSVRVHTGGEAVQMNRELGAQAFTHGSDVYFGAGKEPGNNELTAHELTHVVQQTGVVQRDIIIQCSSLNDYSDPGNLQHDPSRLSDTDIQATDEYQHLQQRFFPQQSPSPASVQELLLACRLALRYIREHQVSLTEAYLETFLPQARRQLAVTSESEGMVGQQMTWIGSGPGSGNTFETWASASSEQTAPPVSSLTTINCWEMILLAAYNAGMVSWQWIHNTYTAHKLDWYSYLVQALSGSGGVPYRIGHPNTLRPLRGDIVFFDGAAHVALANGVTDSQGRTQIISFWPPPDTPFTLDTTTTPISVAPTLDRVKVTTIEELNQSWTQDYGQPAFNITFATAPW